MAIRVVLGEDSFLAREAIEGVLQRAEGIELVAACSDLDGLRAMIDEITHQPEPAVGAGPAVDDLAVEQRGVALGMGDDIVRRRQDDLAHTYSTTATSTDEIGGR